MLLNSFLFPPSDGVVSGVAELLRVFLWAVFLLIPLSVTEIRRLPLAGVSAKMRAENTALAGDDSVSEYASVNAVSVRAETFFRRNGIILGRACGSHPERITYYIRSIFFALGDPLSTVAFGDDSEEPDRSLFTEQVKIVSLTERAVSAYIEGALIELSLAGDEKSGFLLFDPEASPEESAYRIPMSISEEGHVIGTCSFYVQNDDEYSNMIRTLFDHGLRVRVIHYSFLPFVTKDTLQIVMLGRRIAVRGLLNLAGDPAAERLRKKYTRDESAVSGIAALNAPKDLSIPLIYARKMKRYNRFASGVAWASILFGGAVALLIAIGVFPINAAPLLFFSQSILFAVLTYCFSRYYLS